MQTPLLLALGVVVVVVVVFHWFVQHQTRTKTLLFASTGMEVLVVGWWLVVVIVVIGILVDVIVDVIVFVIVCY